MDTGNTADSKILILYLVKNAPGVSYQMLMDKCMESLYTDFFGFSECYNQLIAGNLIDKIEVDTGTGEVLGKNETLYITSGGQAILEDVEGSINRQSLGYLRKASEELSAALAEQNAVTAFAQPLKESPDKVQVELTRTLDGNDFKCSFICSKEESGIILNKWRTSSAELMNDWINKIKS